MAPLCSAAGAIQTLTYRTSRLIASDFRPHVTLSALTQRRAPEPQRGSEAPRPGLLNRLMLSSALSSGVSVIGVTQSVQGVYAAGSRVGVHKTTCWSLFVSYTHGERHRAAVSGAECQRLEQELLTQRHLGADQDSVLPLNLSASPLATAWREPGLWPQTSPKSW